jgi:uncharacterized phiE125 gp8 family phage protein
VTAVTSFGYLDVDGASQSLVLNTDYILDISSDVARLKAVDSWPSTNNQINAVTIVYTAGFGAAADVPQGIKQAILMCTANMYNFRTSQVEGGLSVVDYTVRTILDRYRVTWNANY